jgi:branched-chain amino acid transport system ATP-binding protein
MALLELRGVTKNFGGLTALSDVTFNVNEKEILGLIGPNGSGKTTLFSTIIGNYRPNPGAIVFREREITGFKPHRICQMGIARTFQLTRPFGRMTCLDNVIVGRAFGNAPARSLGENRREAHDVLVSVGLEHKEDVEAARLNLLERKRLELARALATRPYLLLLDEIMGGLNPAEMAVAVELVRTINRSGVTIVIVEHVMKAILGLSQRIVVLDAGRKIAEGAPGEIVENPDVIKAYFGASHHA